MTCGGIFFIVLLVIGASWLSDQVNSAWPLWVVGVLIILFIAWRVFEYVYQRRMVNRFDVAMESALRADAAHRASRTVLSEHRRQVEGGRWADFLLVRYPDGSMEWVVDYDTPLLPDAREQASERRIVEELNEQWRRNKG
jgi:hypothetical protein